MRYFYLFARGLVYVLSWLLSVTRLVFRGTITSIKRGFYQNIYISYGVVFTIISLYLYRYNSEFINILRFVVAIFIAVFLFYILVSIIRRTVKGSEERYKQFMGWFIASSFYIPLISILLINYTSIVINIFVVSFSLLVYYSMRYVLLRWIKHWFAYSLAYFLMPLVSLFIWIYFGALLNDFMKSDLFLMDSIVWWMVLFISIILINLSVIWTPYERIDEVRVSMYLLLAFFSTISYCFFISDYLAPIINPYIDILCGESFTELEIKHKIENFITWATLPYLIGAVFGCFTIELVCRNYNRQKSNNT